MLVDVSELELERLVPITADVSSRTLSGRCQGRKHGGVPSLPYLDEEDLVVGLPLEERGLLRLQLDPLQSQGQLVL